MASCLLVDGNQQRGGWAPLDGDQFAQLTHIYRDRERWTQSSLPLCNCRCPG